MRWGITRTPEQLGHKKDKKSEKILKGEISTKAMIRKFGKRRVSEMEGSVREWLEMDEEDYRHLFGKNWKEEMEKDIKFWTYANLEDS